MKKFIFIPLALLLLGAGCDRIGKTSEQQTGKQDQVTQQKGSNKITTEATAYKIRLGAIPGRKQKSQKTDVGRMQLLEPAFGKINDSLILGLANDARNRPSLPFVISDKPWWSEGDYYIAFVAGAQSPILSPYQTDGVNVEITKMDPQYISYIKDADYCQQDSDCRIRTEFCSVGAFNNFSQMTNVPVFGCEFGMNYPDEDQFELGVEAGKAFAKTCKKNEKTILPEIEYAVGARCIDNKCMPRDTRTKRFYCQ